jgi:hypothetical protein
VFLVLEKVMPQKWKRNPELLTLPNIPKPLHGLNPRTVLGQSWWNKERAAAYKSTNYHCEACGVHKLEQPGRKILEGHEVYLTDYQEGTCTYIRTAPLCPPCHQYIHDGRLLWLLQSGQITHQRYSSVIKRGDKILAEAGLSKPDRRTRERYIVKLHEEGKLAKWADWRLVVNGIEFPTLYATEKEYQEKFIVVDQNA